MILFDAPDSDLLNGNGAQAQKFTHSPAHATETQLPTNLNNPNVERFKDLNTSYDRRTLLLTLCLLIACGGMLFTTLLLITA